MLYAAKSVLRRQCYTASPGFGSIPGKFWGRLEVVTWRLENPTRGLGCIWGLSGWGRYHWPIHRRPLGTSAGAFKLLPVYAWPFLTVRALVRRERPPTMDNPQLQKSAKRTRVWRGPAAECAWFYQHEVQVIRVWWQKWQSLPYLPYYHCMRQIPHTSDKGRIVIFVIELFLKVVPGSATIFF